MKKQKNVSDNFIKHFDGEVYDKKNENFPNQMIDQIYEKCFSIVKDEDLKFNNKVEVQIKGINNLFKQVQIQNFLENLKKNALKESNIFSYPREMIEDERSIEEPFYSFLNFQDKSKKYDIKTENIKMRMFNLIKQNYFFGIEEKLLERIQSFDEHKKVWKVLELDQEDIEKGDGKIQEFKPSNQNENEDEMSIDLIAFQESIKNRQDMTSYHILNLSDGEYAVQTIFDCIKQEHGIAFHKLQFEGPTISLTKLAYFKVKIFNHQDLIYSWITDSLVSFKVIKDSVFFFQILVLDDNQQYQINLMQYDLVLKQEKIVKTFDYECEVQKDKDKRKLEFFTILFVNDYNEKNVYDFTANQILDEQHVCVIDIALKSHDNFNINFAKSCYLHVRKLNCFRENLASKYLENNFSINIWYPIKAIIFDKHVSKDLCSFKKDIEKKPVGAHILIINFNDGPLNFKQNKQAEKLLPDVIAAFQIEESKSEYGEDLRDLQLPENRALEEENIRFDKNKIQTHVKFNEFIENLSMNNSCNTCWIKRIGEIDKTDEKVSQMQTSIQQYFDEKLHFQFDKYIKPKVRYVNQQQTFSRNMNDFFKQFLQSQWSKQLKNQFDRNDKIYLGSGQFRDTIQLFSSSILMNKNTGMMTTLIHIKQDSRESQVIIWQFEINKWLNEQNQQTTQFGYNQYFLQLIQNNNQEIFRQSLLTLTRETCLVCRTNTSIIVQNKKFLDRNFKINQLISSQVLISRDGIQQGKNIDKIEDQFYFDQIKNLDRPKTVFIQHQSLIKQFILLEMEIESKIYNVEDLVFPDDIKRNNLKLLKTVFQDDDRREIPLIAYNIKNEKICDASFAILRSNKILQMINLQQGEIKLNNNYSQICLSQSSEVYEGKRKNLNHLLIKYYCQNFMFSIYDYEKKFINFVEIQTKWIPNDSQMDIELYLIGVKTMYLNEEDIKFECFPLFKQMSEKEGKVHFQIQGIQVILEVQKKIENKYQKGSESQHSESSFIEDSDSFSSNGPQQIQIEQKQYTIVYDIKNPQQDEFNFVNRFSKSRLKEIDDEINGMLAETWLNYDFVQMSSCKVFQDDVILRMLFYFNRKAQNSNLCDIFNFMNSQIFRHPSLKDDYMIGKAIFNDNMQKMFEGCQILNGKSLIELIKDPKIIDDIVINLKDQNQSKKYGFQYITSQKTDLFCLNSLQKVLKNDKQCGRYEQFINEGILFDEECIQFNMDYQSLIHVFLEDNDFKSASVLVNYLVNDMNVHQNQYSQIMSLMHIITQKKWFNQYFFQVFQDQSKDEIVKNIELFRNKIDISISSMVCSENQLSSYMKKPLNVETQEFEQGEINIDYFAKCMKKKFSQEKADSKDFLVKYSVIIVQDYSIQKKLSLILQSKDFNQLKQIINMKFTQFTLANWLSEIISMNFQNIENQGIIRDLIDFQFQQTKRFYQFNLKIFLFFYIFPLFIQMRMKLDSTWIIIANISCLISQLYFYQYEMIDMSEGFIQYFSSIWNIIDTNMFIFYLIYFVIRVFRTENFIPEISNAQTDEINNVQNEFCLVNIMPLFNLFIVCCAFFRLLFYARIFDKYGELIQLFTICLYQISSFTVFLFVWVILFAFLFKIMGANFDDSNPFSLRDQYDDNHNDYRKMPRFLIYILQTFRNSIGDISTPHYMYWWKRIEEKFKIEEGEERYKTAMFDTMEDKRHPFAQFSIYIIWILWIIQIYVMVIIMLNFLIAIVSQSYENVMTKRKETHYLQRSELNQEYMQVMDYFDKNGYKFFTKFFNYNNQNFDFLMIASSRDNEKNNEDQWFGLVKTISKIITEKNENVLGLIKNQEQRLQNLEAKIEQNKDEILENIQLNRKTLQTFEKKMDYVIKYIEYKNSEKDSRASTFSKRLSKRFK